MGPRAGARWEGPLQGCAAAADRFWAALERIVKRRLRLVKMDAFLTAFGVAAISFTFGSIRFARPRLRIFKNPAFLTSTFGLAAITFALGGISAWCRRFLHRVNGLSVANASLVVGAITVIDGIGGTLVGGWIAHRWQRTDHRALYLVSFWSVVFTIPFGFWFSLGRTRPRFLRSFAPSSSSSSIPVRSMRPS